VPKRLLIRPGAIGDFILSLPALEFLRDDHTEVWAASPNVPLARFADRARSISSTGLDRLGILDAGDVVDRLGSFDSIHSWYGTNRPEFRDLVTSLGLPFTFYQALPEGSRHATDHYLEQVGAATGGIPHIECRFARRSGMVIIHPFASNPAKRWPLARYEELAALIEAEGKLSVKWCRGPEDDLPHGYFVENLYELGAGIATAAVFVGNDSGISHLAAAVGTPVVALFGNTDPRVWAPRGTHSTAICSLDSSAAEVYEQIIRIAEFA
jgi:lipopolysaccharide heptosyltransferase III